MTATVLVDCRCGHARGRHPEHLEDACAIRECGCKEYLPGNLPVEVPVPCRCGHLKGEHEHKSLAPQCARPACTCLRYREPQALVVPSRHVALVAPTPRPPEPAPHEPRVPGPRPPTIEQILHAGRRSASKRIAALTEKITAEIENLRGRLAEERHAAEQALARESLQTEAKAEIARLEAALAAAKAKLRQPDRPPSRTSTATPRPAPAAGCDYACPDCGRTFAKAQGLGPHRAKVHGYRVNTP